MVVVRGWDRSRRPGGSLSSPGAARRRRPGLVVVVVRGWVVVVVVRVVVVARGHVSSWALVVVVVHGWVVVVVGRVVVVTRGRVVVVGLVVVVVLGVVVAVVLVLDDVVTRLWNLATGPLRPRRRMRWWTSPNQSFGAITESEEGAILFDQPVTLTIGAPRSTLTIRSGEAAAEPADPRRNPRPRRRRGAAPRRRPVEPRPSGVAAMPTIGLFGWFPNPVEPKKWASP